MDGRGQSRSSIAIVFWIILKCVNSQLPIPTVPPPLPSTTQGLVLPIPITTAPTPTGMTTTPSIIIVPPNSTRPSVTTLPPTLAPPTTTVQTVPTVTTTRTTVVPPSNSSVSSSTTPTVLSTPATPNTTQRPVVTPAPVTTTTGPTIAPVNTPSTAPTISSSVTTAPPNTILTTQTITTSIPLTPIITTMPPVPTLSTTQTPTTLAPPSVGGFVCVPIGTCPPIPTSTVPDIRIVTPISITCPPGQVACPSATAGGNQCGLRFVTANTAVDGSAVPGAYPWQAFITNPTSFIGSGVLIDQIHVVRFCAEVAECSGVFQKGAHQQKKLQLLSVPIQQNTPQNIRLAFGVWDPLNQTNAQNRIASRIIVHPNYSPSTLRNNIAIVRLNLPVVLGTPSVNTACVPSAATSYVGRVCQVSGWGASQFNLNDAPTRPQRQVSVPIVDYSTCRQSLSAPTVLGANVDIYLDPSGQLCAGGEENRDACTQDGGAPLVCEDLVTRRSSIAGIVIWGKGCRRRGVYGVYTNIPFYANWINTTVTALNVATG